MVILRPKGLPRGKSVQSSIIIKGDPGFICHPSTSELASALMVDPEAIKNENYSGIFDENGDYVPQFCDDPEKLPRSVSMEANQESKGETPAPPAERGAECETPAPANNETPAK